MPHVEPTWDAVDQYFTQQLIPSDAALDAALAASADAALPSIQVTASQGRLLELLARMCGARRILEIGTLAGYSTIWLGRALPPDGRLVTLEIDAGRAELARENLERAALGDRVQIMIAPAAESLAQLAADRSEPFDLVFIDADKESSDAYLLAVLALSRVGTVIIVDNVVRDGRVADADSTDASIQGVRRMVELLSRDRRVSATAVQSVGSKGYDGFLIALVTSLDAG